MRTKLSLIFAASVMLVVTTLAVASNMGFKISIPLLAGASNWVSLPYFNSYSNADAVFRDVPNCVQVSRWDPASWSYQSWFGNGVGNDFTLNEGEALLIKVSVGENWIVVGSHDPTKAVALVAGASNWVSVPYHTTAADASTLFGQIPNAVQVSRWDPASWSYQSWFGNGVGTNFSLRPGEGLLVKVSVSSNTWQPAHY